MGGKKKKGGKEPRNDPGVAEDEQRGSSTGAGERKKSKKRKKEVDDDYEDELAELVNELDLEGESKNPIGGPATSTTTGPEDLTGAALTTEDQDTMDEDKKKEKNEFGLESKTKKPASVPATATTATISSTGTGPEAATSANPTTDETTREEEKKKKKKKKKKSEEIKSSTDSTAPETATGAAINTVATPLSTDTVTMNEDKSAADGEEDTGAAGTDDANLEEDKKKKKKKKKKAEEEKKSSKGPGKSAISKIKKMQAFLEEQKLQREHEALAAQRAEEEQEMARLEKLRLEKERKERLKQKEKERKQRRKQEGKPVTKKEKEAEIRRLAQLAALEEQGIVIPDKDTVYTEKKKVVYGSRQRTRRTDTQKGASADDLQESVEEQMEEGLEDEQGEEKPGVDSWEDLEEMAGKPGVDSWEDLGGDSEQDEATDGATQMSTEMKGNTVVGSKDSVAGSGGAEGHQYEEDEEEEEEGDSSDSSSEEENAGLSPFEKAKIRIQRRRQRHAEERSVDTLRSPVVCVLGHVDTGKTKILDKIRKTNVQDGEAGGITQQIGATFVPEEAIREQTKMLKEFSKAQMTLPGLLIIDTPGHESFSNLRTRGSSMCDLAVLVVDIMHGLEAQTKESLNLLKKGKVPFIVALNKVDRLYEWHRNPNSSIRDTLKKQKQPTRDQLDERVREVTREFNEEGLNVAMFWEKVDFNDYLPMVLTSAITGDGMGDLIALLVQHSIKSLTSALRLSMEVEALVMEVKVIAGLGTTIDVILRNGLLREGDVMVLSGNEGPFVATVRALLMPQPLRELRVKNAYVSHSAVMAAQGIKVIAKGELEKTLPGTNVLIAKRPDEVDVLKEEAAVAMKSVLNSIKLQDRGVYVQASTLGSLEALLEFLKTSKIPYSGINIGPVHKRDVMKASVMLEHDNQWAVILAFDIRIERDAQEMADSLGVKIFSADIIYHLFDSFLKHRQELREKNRQLYRSIAVFPCRLRILPNCVFNTRDPIVMGVVVESGIVKPGTPLTVPSKEFTDIGVVTSLEVNHKTVESVRKGTEVCVKIEPVGGEAPRLYGRHFDHTDLLVSKVNRESIDAIKNYFREDLNKSDWQLIIELKKLFQIM